ncbi:selenocysteine insertion sequence-binding protein 2-like isoform X2 [Carcharodon carcharias]|uniref:selenocysteine insertion sequence-binding protein 2-like isoform X2 n=1 Tax=Carcharodon carcharias TaxID=13397 RepID=UPI001B7E8340|nr:selenocysteine insertion sequence-binding protein 2-like isoform X2 [Carcharodon carcharias]
MEKKEVAKDTQLSAEVEPFIPQKKGTDILVPMALPNDGNGSGVEAPPIPSYLITCYPFVQENQANRQLPVYNGDIRWQQANPNSTGPYLAYPILPTPQPPVSTDYAYYQLMPAPCTPMVGFYSPFPAPYTASFQPPNVVNAVSGECSERPAPAGQACQAAAQRSKNNRGPVPKVLRTSKPLVRSVAVQKESNASGPENRSKIVLLVDASQQTDFPGDVANKSLSERASPLLWKSKVRRRRASHPAAESSSEQGASEADIDSDSGYCSPKHSHSLTTSATTRSTECKVDDLTGITGGPSWANVASQVPQRFGMDRIQTFSCGRSGRPANLRNSQDNSRGKVQSLSSPRMPSQQKSRDWTAGQSPETQQFVNGRMTGDDQKSDSLCFEDDSEFPELIIGVGVSKSKAHDNAQNKNPSICQLTKKQLGLGDLPETSPINIVQTPIPITTAIPKRAKSQRKKALAAALATAQEYSEISMEQKKLQALNKAAGRKSKAPVQLDLGDMLAALEKQQQAMKAKQLTNTKPLSYSVGTTTLFSVKDCGSMKTLHKNQQFIGFHNPLDSGAPRMKRGKEREIPKAKRPTALKKIILKEREEKKNRFSIEPTVVGSEEQGDVQLSFPEEQTITQEVVSQEDIGLSVPSDTSLSPASQNSPYSMTPVSQGSPVSSGVGSPMASSTITKIHSRRFREYCNQVLSKDIDECVTLLLQELVRFQERIYQKDPIKAKMKRRLVMGLREVTKHMRLRKIKCVIISPNCEKIQSKGGLDEALYNVIAMAREQEIPFVFALGRKALGRCVNKLVPVSVVGIFNYSGAESLFNKLVALTEEARKAYRDMVTALEQEQAEEALKHTRKVSHMGHSRNPSAASAISFCSVISEPISEVNEKEYETNWRNMVEATDAPECSESEKPTPSATTVLDKSSSLPAVIGSANKPILGITTSSSVGQTTHATKSSGSDKEEGKTDDMLEWASQQSTETGSLDGSCRDVLNSSMISTTSTLVPDMLEEEDDDEEEEEEEEEEDYASEPVAIVVTFSSRIDDWVSEAQKTLETLQLGKNIDNTEEDHNGQSDIEELDTVGQTDATTESEGSQHAESESQIYE